MNKPVFNTIDPVKKSRTYIFPLPDGDISVFTIEGVCSLAVSSSGTHRLETTDGEKYIIPNKWIAIDIDVEDWSF